MPVELIVLRTDHYDLNTDEFVRRLQKSSGRRVVVAADEHAHPVQLPPDITKISVSATNLDLYNHSNYGWCCGDYFLYAVATEIQEADYIWLIEPDVRIHSSNVAHFFDGSVPTDDVDFITPWFVPASKEWVWYDSISPYYPNVTNCMIQLARFSRSAIDYLYLERCSLSRKFIEQGLYESRWSNDEAFIGAALASSDLKTMTFDRFAPDFSIKDTFTFTRPTSERWLKSVQSNNAIYHPVVAGPKFHSRKHAFLSNMSHLSELDQLNAVSVLEMQSLYEPA